MHYTLFLNSLQRIKVFYMWISAHGTILRFTWSDKKQKTASTNRNGF